MIAGLILLALLWAVPSQAAGPWEAQVVDAVTHAPLEGVSVLALWHRRAHGHPAIGFGRTGFHSSAETTSGPMARPSALEVTDLLGGGGQRAHLDDHSRAGEIARRAAKLEAAPSGGRSCRGSTARARRTRSTFRTKRPLATLDQLRLRQAGGIAVDAKGHVYVADTDNHRIVKFDRELNPLATWGTFGRGDAQLQLPRSITVDGETVYVADWGNHRVQKFTTDGRFLGKWGELRYNELGGTFTPTVVAMTRAGEIVVYAGRVYRFSGDGGLIAQWGKSLQLNSRSQIAVDADGHVYGITGQHGRERSQVIKLDRSGAELASWGRQGHEIGELFDPIALAVDHAGRVYVACWGGGTNPRIVVFDAAGKFVHQWDVKGGRLPSLRLPSGIAIDPQGSVYVTDLRHDRVHKLRAPGR